MLKVNISKLHMVSVHHPVLVPTPTADFLPAKEADFQEHQAQKAKKASVLRSSEPVVEASSVMSLVAACSELSLVWSQARLERICWRNGKLEASHPIEALEMVDRSPALIKSQAQGPKARSSISVP